MENINLIRKIAWSFHTTTGIEWDDLFSEAIQSYYKALEQYDPSKGKITTHVYHHIKLHMINYLKKYKKENGCLFSLEDTEVMEFPSDQTPSPSFFEGLSNDANIIAKMIIGSADKYVCLDRKDVEKTIIKTMKEQHWAVTRTKASIREIEVACECSV